MISSALLVSLVMMSSGVDLGLEVSPECAAVSETVVKLRRDNAKPPYLKQESFSKFAERYRAFWCIDDKGEEIAVEFIISMRFYGDRRKKYIFNRETMEQKR